MGTAPSRATEQRSTAAWRMAPLCAALSLVVACADTVPVVPLGARAQRPSGGSPAQAWQAAEGRAQLTVAGARTEVHALVRRQADGQVRLGLLGDDGSVWADLLVGPQGCARQRIRPDLEAIVPLLAHAVRQAWVVDQDQPRWVDGWVVGRWGDAERYYGGDPLVLRKVAGGGPDLVVEDYRVDPAGLLAHEVRAIGFGASLRLTIGTAGPVTAAPPPAPGMPAMTLPDAW